MPEWLANAAVLALGVYAVLGAAFAAWFVVRGIGGLDPAARGSGVWFRLIILPGVVALWPVLALKARAAGGASGSADGGGSSEGHA